ncbi:MAG: acyl-CoA dehydrogenase family protein [Candidatus Marinimicrobia bacterium]|nr:acyl-CoA dehydrogenase family protein [Candidatus Neomarinimicrobiota bacterium]
MPNFFKDNDDLIFHFKHIDLNKIIEFREDNFTEANKYGYAPKNLNDAKDSYKRILQIVGQITGDVIEPNAAEVDEIGAKFKNGEVTYAPGTKVGLDAMRKADLMGFTVPRKYGGINAPMTLYCMAIEMTSRADAGFMNIFGLQSNIADTIYKYADEKLKDKYLPILCKENVTSSMALTEPDAGSDLQAVMLKAHQNESGQWFLNGVKRFITNGKGEISLVLARSEAGSEDGRGLSMFLYERDDKMKIRRIENKLGIHGSPTCELQFNDAPVYLIGKRRMGLIKYVMSLMNEARIGIAAQSLGIAEAAYREAKQYSEERKQFKQPIKNFIAVSELLGNMKVKIEAGRSLLYETAVIVDMKNSIEEHIKKYPDENKKYRKELKKYTAYSNMLTPIVKAFNTEMSNEVAYDGIQIHGGTGYMKEFNAERHFRDARITNIYEGTTQLQVVAAIGGIMKGVFENLIDEYEENNDFNSLEIFHKQVQAMASQAKDTIDFIKENNDKDFQSYHARRLVEMSTKVIIGYLFLRDANHSERKKDVLKYFLEFAMPEVKMKSKIILNKTKSFLENKSTILENKN